MTKYNNFVYLTICEVTLKTYKRTGFSTHGSYCRWMGISLNDEKVSSLVKLHVSIISEVLKNIFAMDAKTSGVYIADYFLQNKYVVFENVVRATKEFYPTTEDLY
jgi:hypothetical protein